MNEKRIYLIRHAEPQKVDNKKRYLGQSDLALSEKGILQAKQLAAFFLKKDFLENPFEIYCSDLTRAKQTADILARALNGSCKNNHVKSSKENLRINFYQVLMSQNKVVEPKPMSALREIDMGTWDGKRFDEIKRDFPEEFQKRGEDIANFRPPEGECFLDVEKRAMIAFDAICEKISHSVVIVAHAGVNRVILRRLLGKSFDELFTIRQGYGCVNEIRLLGMDVRSILSEYQPCRFQVAHQIA